MSAWMAVRCDAPIYGKIIVYNFPKQKLVYGPRQIEARINQDAAISQQLSLWNQRGSQVIRGSLLAIPIEQSILYVQPLYLAAETGTAAGAEAGDRRLRQLHRHGGKPGARPPKDLRGRADQREGSPENGGLAGPRARTTARQMASEALGHYRKAQELLRQGNWAGYGEELRKLEEALRNLEKKK